MAQVAVFVDDAVRGTLPDVCARDGVPTTDRLTSSTAIGDGARLGVAWLLLFAGPIGWIALLFLSSSRNGGAEILRVDLPLSRAAWEREEAAGRRRSLALLVAAGGGALGFYGAMSQLSIDTVLIVVGIAIVVGGMLAWLRADSDRRLESVGVELDASRRWVTLSNVHPTFVAACQAQSQHHRV
jgi:hypothetical protein